MSKLALTQRVPRQYDAATIQDIVRQVEQQGNKLAEGSIAARHGAMTAAPTAGSWVRGDIVDNSTPTNVSDAISDYVIAGWICTASGSPGTWKERRVLTESITIDLSQVTPTLGTEVATTSGTSIDFTGIPSWVKKITLEFVAVSTNGTSLYLLQLGDSGGVETSGYVSGSSDNAPASANSTAGFLLTATGNAAASAHGSFTLHLEDAANFHWVGYGGVYTQTNLVSSCAGSKATSAALDRIRLTTVNGTDTFDAGAVNILYG